MSNTTNVVTDQSLRKHSSIVSTLQEYTQTRIEHLFSRQQQKSVCN